MADEQPANDVSVSAQDAASLDAEGSSPSQSTAAPAGVSSTDVNQPSDQTNEPTDALAGVPTLEELQGKENVPYAKAVAQLRGVYEPLKTQFDELSTKYQPYEPVLDRFQKPEELQSLVDLNDSLNKYSPDPVTGALRPDPTEFVEQLSTSDPERADFMTSALIWGETKHPATGQPVTRAELVLQVMAQDPQLRSHALQVLGGVDQSTVPAPSWTPSEEELNKINDPENPTAEGRALQEVYKKLSYEERDELRLSSPEFIKSQLRTIQQNQLLQANEERRVIAEQDAQVQAEQRAEQEASAAGDSYVEQGFKEGLTNFANHIYETWKPTDDPIVNKREGAQVALSVVALSHPDTRWAGEQMLKEMGIDPKDLEPLNKAREAYANTSRQYGYLTHKKQRVTGEDPSRAQQRMIVQAQNLATKIIAGRNEYFTKRAQSHNDKLDQTERARVPIGGSAPSNGSGNRYLQAGKRTEAEIYGS